MKKTEQAHVTGFELFEAIILQFSLCYCHKA